MPLFQLPRQFHVASNGTPYASARLYTYRANTTTPLDVYTTIDYDTEHANPVEADANGIFPAIYIDPDSGYDLKIELKTSADVLIYTEDDIPRQDSDFANGDFSGNVAVAGTLEVTGATTLSGAQVTSAEPRIKLYESDAATDKKFWDIDVQGSVLSIRTRTDADAVGKDILKITRGTTTAISQIDIGNSTDAPVITLNGTNFPNTGSFTGTLTGMDSATTGTVSYRIVGGMCTLYLASSISGTSNTTGLSMTGLPAACTPSVSRALLTTTTDNGASIGSYCTVSSFAFIQFNTLAVSGAVVGIGGAYTNSGTKGLGSSWTITYPL